MAKIGLLLLFLLVTSPLFAQQTVDYVLTGVKQQDPAFAFADAVLEEISARMGTHYTLSVMPHKRAVHELQEGRLHADLVRSKVFSVMVPGAIQVAEPIVSYPYYAYSKTLTSLAGQGLDRIKPYRIVTVIGSSFTMENLQDFNTYAVATSKDALLFLDAGRADILVGPPLVMTPLLQSPRLINSEIKAIEPLITMVNHYTFFAPQYPALAKQFNAALIAIKNEGVYQRIQQRLGGKRR